MRLIGNILWLIFGGFFIAFSYFIAAFVMFVTIVGIPFGIQALKLGALALFPFGRSIVQNNTEYRDLSLFLNVFWLLLAGIWLTLAHLFLAAALCITIVGIPFGIQHFKMARMALWPFGQYAF